MMKTTPKINKLFLFVLLVCVIFPLLTLADEAEEKPRQCPTFAELSDVKQAAFLIQAYKLIQKVFVSAADTSWGAFAGPLQAIVALGIGIYIALATLKNIGAFSQQDVAAYLTADKKGVIPLAVKGAFIIYLLTDKGFVYSYLVTPIVSGGAEIGGSGGFGGGFSGSVGDLFGSVISYATDFLGRAYQITAMGRMLLCLAFLPESIIDWYWTMIPFGAILFVFGWMIVIGVSFYLLDVMFRLGVGCILLPMAIACGESKLTSHYTKQTWGLFINVAFNFAMLGIIISFTIQMINQSLSGLNSGTNVAEMLKSIGGKVPDQADTDALNDALTLAGFVLLVLACMISFKLFMSVEQVADKVSHTSSVGKLGQETGKKALSTAKNIATEPVKQTGKFAKSVGNEMTEDLKNSESARGVRRAWRWSKASAKKLLRVKD